MGEELLIDLVLSLCEAAVNGGDVLLVQYMMGNS